ncbi:nucleoside/nucleotide kinase family protein [Jatrophihabitans fulvus]
MTAHLDDLVVEVRRLMADRRRVILGITGAPGAGKSTVADALCQRIGPTSAVVGMDGFHLAQAELERLGRADRKGAPDTFDSWGYAALLQRLRTPGDHPVYAPVFRREIEEPVAGAVRVDPHVRLVITEGNYLLLDVDGWSVARSALDAAWYLEPDDDVRVERLVRRHVAFGKDSATARSWVTDVDEENARTVRGSRDGADLVIRLTDGATPGRRRG